MEDGAGSEDRLYSGPLSQAAKKILAVLRTNSLVQPKCKQPFTSQRSETKCSQSGSWALNCTSQEKEKDEFPYQPQVLCLSTPEMISQTSSSCQRPDSSLPSQTSPCLSICLGSSLQRAPLFSQHRALESEASICGKESSPFSNQEGDGTSKPQTIPSRNPHRRTEPSFTFGKSSDEEIFSKMLSTTPKHLPICPEVFQESDKPSDEGNHSVKEMDISGASFSPGKWKQSNLVEETASGTEIHFQMSESKAFEPEHVLTFANVPEAEERNHTELEFGSLHVQLEDTGTCYPKRQTVGGESDHRAVEQTELRSKLMMERGQLQCSDIQLQKKECERNCEESHPTDAETGKTRQGRHVQLFCHDQRSPSAEVSDGEWCLVPTLSQVCGTQPSVFRAPCLLDNQQHGANEHSSNGSSRESTSSLMLNSSDTIAAGPNLSSVHEVTLAASVPTKELEDHSLHSYQSQSYHLSLPSSLFLKRKCDVSQQQYGVPPLKMYRPRFPPNWDSFFPHKRMAEGRTSVPMSAEFVPQTTPSVQTKNSHFTEHRQLLVPTQTQHYFETFQGQYRETEKDACKQTLSYKSRKSMSHKCSIDPPASGVKTLPEAVSNIDLQSQFKKGCLPSTLMSDSRVTDLGKLNSEERIHILQKAKQSEVLVLTMWYQDGTTQLDPEGKLASQVCGLLILMKSESCCSTPEDSLGLKDSLVYLTLKHIHVWVQDQRDHDEEQFTRDLLLQVISRSPLAVCYKAKDLLRTVLQFYKEDSWKQVSGCQIQDPQVSGWLLDPADQAACYQDLLYKHCKKARSTHSLGPKKVSQILSDLCWLHKLHMILCSKLQSRGLWKLYTDVELKMIPVLAAMESHCIYVDKETLKKMSDLLGTKLKQLEQEAHQAAGQRFLVTSSSQLRTVLFEKLRLHEYCENKKLPKTINKQQSTSEAALLQLQDLHPLPKIILEYRQVHKIKSTFIDGILTCMKSKNYISSTWCQTSAVTGRISAKHPNFQALPKQPLQITKKLFVHGGAEEVVTVHPRAMFVPHKGWTFLAADFCQVELRLLAHFSSDPDLLHLFTIPQADVFTMLAAQWKGLNMEDVSSEDREHAKRIIYSVIYGAGRERLSGILGVSAEQASQFQHRFLQTYRDVQTFIQKTIQQSHKQGYVLSIMGRRRNLPDINSPDWGVRMQSERQAVNFVVQGSAADLCKMAMIRIFNLVSTSSSLTARLVAQLHDELLYEVEDSQLEPFATLVKSTMESLQHIDHLGVHLKVPLKVAVSSGKTWGSMSEFNIPLMPPSS
ncbi:DNA polymerase nu isoform X3 [Oryzias latipes]|uniref:DNA-directed DNA polymerase n=1 Tax=Oryzias latipes TaxID=8090 RepID=A0A3B3H6Z2_ORYLA